MGVLAPVHLEVCDADDAPASAGHEALVLDGSVVVQRHGQTFDPLPPGSLGPARTVRLEQDLEPLVERAPVVRVDPDDFHRDLVHRSRCFCQNAPSLNTSKPSMSLTAIIGSFTEALPVTT